MSSRHSIATSFSMENWLHWIRKGDLPFRFFKKTLSRTLPVYFYAFDLLNRDGESLLHVPIERRRDLLRNLLAASQDPLRLSPLLQASSGEVLETVRRLGLEGVVGKRLDSRYEPGERSGAWIKCRGNLEQKFVVGGYIPGTRGRLGVTRWEGCGRPRDPPFHFSSMPISLRAGLNRSGWGRRPYCLSAASPS